MQNGHFWKFDGHCKPLTNLFQTPIRRPKPSELILGRFWMIFGPIMMHIGIDFCFDFSFNSQKTDSRGVQKINIIILYYNDIIIDIIILLYYNNKIIHIKYILALAPEEPQRRESFATDEPQRRESFAPNVPHGRESFAPEEPQRRESFAPDEPPMR